MNYQRPSYRDFVRPQCQPNPCISGLAEYLGRELEAPSTIISIDYPQNTQTRLNPSVVSETELVRLIDCYLYRLQAHSTRREYPTFLFNLGEILDIDPVFFAGPYDHWIQRHRASSRPPSSHCFRLNCAEKANFIPTISECLIWAAWARLKALHIVLRRIKIFYERSTSS